MRIDNLLRKVRTFLKIRNTVTQNAKAVLYLDDMIRISGFVTSMELKKLIELCENNNALIYFDENGLMIFLV